MDVEVGSNFVHECTFSTQLNYQHLIDDLYVINMESGRKAIYKRYIDDHMNYQGTGQHDFIFTFITYI